MSCSATVPLEKGADPPHRFLVGIAHATRSLGYLSLCGKNTTTDGSSTFRARICLRESPRAAPAVHKVFRFSATRFSPTWRRDAFLECPARAQIPNENHNIQLECARWRGRSGASLTSRPRHRRSGVLGQGNESVASVPVSKVRPLIICFPARARIDIPGCQPPCEVSFELQLFSKRPKNLAAPLSGFAPSLFAHPHQNSPQTGG